jgi:hypothetical protein
MAGHLWKRDEYDPEAIDIFGFDGGYCNGPRCTVCGEGFCHHCEPECYDYECPGIVEVKEVARELGQ